MAYYVTGSNIFRQWLWNDLVINEFRALPESEFKILQVHWAYNILNTYDSIFIAGAWDGKDNQLIKVPVPSDNDIPINIKDLLVTGSDNNLIFICKNTNAIWVLDLKMEKEIKKINFNIEEPVENTEVPKKKKKCYISKVVLVNDSCLYLTSIGNVYCGVLPSYIDTRHCRGKVCDVQCGYEHNVLLTDTGTVYTWGNGRRLQLGHGEVSNLDTPTEVEALAGIKITKISSGGWHSLALSEFGDLYAWGWNDTGQIGIKHVIGGQSYPIPTLVDLYDSDGMEVKINVKDIACGSRHSAIILEDNTVWTTGCNKYGQLGFSEEKYPTVTYFRKAFHCDNSYTLKCGPWTTVLVPS